MQHPTEQRIQSVITSLLPKTPLEGQFDSPRTLHEQLTHYHTPGVSIAVVNDFDIEWAKGFGVCEAGTTHEVKPDTLFQAGSISKPVFALAVMRLVQEGRLDLDRDVNTYLTSWRVPANRDWQPCVTLRNLLSHTAGMTGQGYLGYDSSALLPTTLQILNGDFPANSEKIQVNIIPGLHYRYSGGGMIVAQQVLVDQLEKPFPDIMHELIFQPLRMTHSTYHQPLRPDWIELAATAHPINGTPLGGKHMIYPELAAAGLWTTVTDLAKLGVALINVLQDRQQNIWRKETIQEMLRPQIEQSEGPNGLFVGLGFAGQGEGHGSYFTHSGTNVGFVSEMRFYPSTGQGAVVMLNSNEGDPLREEIMDAIGKIYGWPNMLPPEKEVVTSFETDRYSGQYVSKSGLHFYISSQNGNVFLRLDQQMPLQLFPTSELDFFSKVSNTSVTFEEDDLGNISALVIYQAGVMSLGLLDQSVRAVRQVEHTTKV